VLITTTVRNLVTVTVGTQITNASQLDFTGNPSGTLPSNIVTISVQAPNLAISKIAETLRDPLGAGDIVT
jgi:hypothetical protein